MGSVSDVARALGVTNSKVSEFCACFHVVLEVFCRLFYGTYVWLHVTYIYIYTRIFKYALHLFVLFVMFFSTSVFLTPYCSSEELTRSAGLLTAVCFFSEG